MTPNTPLHRSLAAWREAERRLAKVDAADPTRPRLQADVDGLRAIYQELFEAVEDVAGHGAPYADDADRTDRADRADIGRS